MPITLNGTTGITSPAIDLTTALPVADGGTGATTLNAAAVIIGNDTSAPTFVAPGTSGNVLTSNGSAWTSTTPAGLSRATVVNTTSGTVADFTGIPAGVKRITVMMNQVSSNGGTPFIVQLGTSGGFVTSGYFGQTNTVGVSSTAWSAGMYFNSAGDGNQQFTGLMTIAGLGNDSWTAMTCSARATQFAQYGGGGVNLGGTLTQVRFTSTGGNTFDNGSVNILFE
jgi:hypothetical protein